MGNKVLVCEGIYIVIHIKFFLFAYEAPVSSSRKLPHKAITVVLLQQHDMLCGFM